MSDLKDVIEKTNEVLRGIPHLPPGAWERVAAALQAERDLADEAARSNFKLREQVAALTAERDAAVESGNVNYRDLQQADRAIRQLTTERDKLKAVEEELLVALERIRDLGGCICRYRTCRHCVADTAIAHARAGRKS